MGSQVSETHHVPPEIKEQIAELFPDLTYEEALQDQESLYQLLQISCPHRTQTVSDNDNSIGQGQSSLSRGESSHWGSNDCESQLALDEVLARSLQELDFEEEIDHAAVSEPAPNTTGNTESAAPSASVTGRNQDDIDPDDMSYEELQSLGEAIGLEGRGLSEADISNLPTFIFKKTGFFSKKTKSVECVICCMTFENRQVVTTLPCVHQYHTECINRWLRQNKTCPICQEEVRLSS